MLPRGDVLAEQERGVPTWFMQRDAIHFYCDGIHRESAPYTPITVVNHYLPFFFITVDATVSVNIVLNDRHHRWASIPDVRYSVAIVIVQTTIAVDIPLGMCCFCRTRILGVWNPVAIVIVQATITVCIVPIIDCGLVWTCVIFVANAIPIIVEVVS